MGRPTGFKKGGGFLNNVDATWQDYEFTDVFPVTSDKPRKNKKSDFNSLYAVITVRVDGADEDQQTTLWVGSADDFTIGDDGHTLTPIEEGIEIRDGADWSVFINSLLEAGFPASKAGEFFSNSPDDVIDYRAALGTRFTLVQQPNAEKTQKLGKKKDKDGKEKYDRTDLVVKAVLGAPAGKSAAPASKAAVGGKANGAAKTGVKPGKTNGAAATDPDAELQDVADDTLLAILTEAGGSIMKAKLPGKIALKLGPKHPQKEEIRRMIYSDDYLIAAAERELIAYDASDKKQMISVAA